MMTVAITKIEKRNADYQFVHKNYNGLIHLPRLEEKKLYVTHDGCQQSYLAINRDPMENFIEEYNQQAMILNKVNSRDK